MLYTLHKIRLFIAQCLFPKEYAALAMEKESFKSISERYKARLEELSYERERIVEDVRESVPALVREQLKGFDPKLLDSDLGLPEGISSEIESQNAFLSKMKTLNETPELWTLIDYLTREQIMFSVKEAQTLEAINFARATINGWSLLREEIGRLATVYAERHAADPEFDEHEVV